MQQYKQCPQCGAVFPPSALHCTRCARPLLLAQGPPPGYGMPQQPMVAPFAPPAATGPRDPFEWRMQTFWFWSGAVVSSVLLWWSLQYGLGLVSAYRGIQATTPGPAEGFLSWVVSRMFWLDCVAFLAGGAGLSFCSLRLRRLYTYDYRGVGNVRNGLVAAVIAFGALMALDQLLTLSPRVGTPPDSKGQGATWSQLQALRYGMSADTVGSMLTGIQPSVRTFDPNSTITVYNQVLGVGDTTWIVTVDESRSVELLFNTDHLVAAVEIAFDPQSHTPESFERLI